MAGGLDFVLFLQNRFMLLNAWASETFGRDRSATASSSLV